MSRLRNVPESEDILSDSPCYVADPTDHKGQWDKVFSNENPIFVEVGTGKGQFILESAKRRPDANFIGVELYSSVLCRAAKKWEAMGEEAPGNVRFLCVDARALPEIFGEGEVSGLFVNFSDPWPKARHAKRRLLAPGFLERYEKILRHGGRLEFKTDNVPLFEFSNHSLEASPAWEIEGKTYDLHAGGGLLEGNVMTEYESKFVARGQAICKLVAKLLALLLCLALAWPVRPVFAEEIWPTGVETESESYAVMELESGAVLLDKKPRKKKYPASITKILTALIAIESCDLDETVVFSEDAVFLNEGDTSHISRDVGEKMTMEQCLYAMMLESANECAWAIAEHVGGGSVERFVDMMNEKAASIGCVNSHFVNPNGLPDDDHYTCSEDMAKIAREAFKNKTFRAIVGTRSYSIPPTNKHSEPTPLNNHHSMLNDSRTTEFLYEGCLGGKTGYTDAARNTLVTYARKNGMTLVCVVMDAPKPGFYTDTIRLLDYSFSNFVVYPASKAGSIGGSSKRRAGSLMDANEMFSVDDGATVVLPRTASILDATMKVLPLEDEDEEVVGEVVYDYADHFVGKGTLRFAALDEGYAYPFRNLGQFEDDDDVSYIYVDFVTIGYVLAALAGVVGLVALARLVSPLLYKRRMRRRVIKEERKTKYKKIRSNERKRR